MTPEEAALCLRDDPTFAGASTQEQEAEAALLLGTDDPLDIALAVELALADRPAPTAIMGASDEGCRLETPCVVPRLAGNGRCLDCGAGRLGLRPPSVQARPLSVAEAITPGPRKVRAHSDLRRGVTHDPTATFLGRFKEATGATDKEMGEMLGVSRVSVQAYIAGRRAEALSGAQARNLIDALAEHLLLAATLKRDLAVEIGEAYHD